MNFNKTNADFCQYDNTLLFSEFVQEANFSNVLSTFTVKLIKVY